jgi:hypothetical protein
MVIVFFYSDTNLSALILPPETLTDTGILLVSAVKAEANIWF